MATVIDNFSITTTGLPEDVPFLVSYNFKFDANRLGSNGVEVGYMTVGGVHEVRLRFSYGIEGSTANLNHDVGYFTAVKPNSSIATNIAISGSFIISSVKNIVGLVPQFSTAVYNSAGTFLGSQGKVTGEMWVSKLP
jgi:hypothetical protein